MGEPRVLHVITGLGMGGAEQVATQIALPRGPLHSIAWLKGENRWAARLEAAGVTAYPLSMRGITGLPAAVRELVRLLRETRPDILHTHLVHAHIVGRWAARIAPKSRKGAEIPVVSTEHNLRYYGSLKHRWLDRWDVRSSWRNRAVIAISQATLERCLQAGYRAETLRVIYNGVELPTLSTTEGTNASSKNRKPALAMVGRIHADKGTDLFLRALELLPEAQGILAGSDPGQSPLRTQVAAAVAAGRLRWDSTGDVLPAYREADIVVLPSRHEGLGLVALEAMSYGKPVIASRIGGLLEVVENEVTGLLIPLESPEAIVGAVQRMHAFPGQAREMGQAGRKRVEALFTLEEMLSKYALLYRNQS